MLLVRKNLRLTAIDQIVKGRIVANKRKLAATPLSIIVHLPP
jgi:hypothetical protein